MRQRVPGKDVAVGVVTRTGSAVTVTLSGFADEPVFVGRRELALAPAGLPAQPYHAAADLEIDVAAGMIGQVERGAEKAGAAGLRVVADGLPAGTAILGVAVVVKAVSLPRSIPDVLRSHAWMHAAEGMLYREAVLAAARRHGWAAHAVDMSLLPAAERAVTELGRVAGRPWRKMEKDAARAAITLLPQSASRP